MSVLARLPSQTGGARASSSRLPGRMLFACAANAQASGASPAHDEMFFVCSDLDLAEVDSTHVTDTRASAKPPMWLCVATKAASTNASTSRIPGPQVPATKRSLEDSRERERRILCCLAN